LYYRKKYPAAKEEDAEVEPLIKAPMESGVSTRGPSPLFGQHHVIPIAILSCLQLVSSHTAFGVQSVNDDGDEEEMQFWRNVTALVCAYLMAGLYIGSRVPQIIQNVPFIF
jgi:hypothetical protein